MLGACAIVNLNCLRLMNEHTAAALSYGIYKSARNLLHQKDPEYTMLLNLGHSTLQVSIVSHIQGNLRVQAATFGRNLGSRDFDLALANKFDEQFAEKFKGAKSTGKFVVQAQKAKKSLSPQGVAQTNLRTPFSSQDPLRAEPSSRGPPRTRRSPAGGGDGETRSGRDGRDDDGRSG